MSNSEPEDQQAFIGAILATRQAPRRFRHWWDFFNSFKELAYPSMADPYGAGLPTSNPALTNSYP